jgi:ferredoxin--NADP+ reductase
MGPQKRCREARRAVGEEREGEPMPKVLEYNATLAGRDDLTDALGIFRVVPDEPFPTEGPWFVPGQYMVLGLNNEEEPELAGVQRPMSIASAPEDPSHVEFYIRFVSQPASRNPFTHQLWKRQEGDRIFIRPKAKGHFTVEHAVGPDDSRRKVFVSAGTGLAPFVSIVRSARNRAPGRDLGEFVILHGASYDADLGYREELERLAREEGLHYVPTVSRAAQCEGWSGAQGRAEDQFRADRIDEFEQRAGFAPGELRPDRAVLFVCGLQGTIGASIERLLGRGFVPDEKKLRRALEVPEETPASIYFEQYDSDPVIDLTDEGKVAALRDTLHGALGL